MGNSAHGTSMPTPRNHATIGAQIHTDAHDAFEFDSGDK
jgi:hypothetical protein